MLSLPAERALNPTAREFTPSETALRPRAVPPSANDPTGAPKPKALPDSDRTLVKVPTAVVPNANASARSPKAADDPSGASAPSPHARLVKAPAGCWVAVPGAIAQEAALASLANINVATGNVNKQATQERFATCGGRL